MARSGRDPSQFARDLLAHLRHLLVTQTTGEVPATFVVTATDTERIKQQAGAVGAAALVRTIDELAAALTAVREGDDARMAVEIALLKAARPDLDPTTEGLLRRIEKLERQLAGGGPPPTPVLPPPPSRPPEPTPTTPHPSRPEPQASAPEAPASGPPAPEPAAPEPRPQASEPPAAQPPSAEAEPAQPAADAPPAGGAPVGAPQRAQAAPPPSTVGETGATGPAAEDPPSRGRSSPTSLSPASPDLDQVTRIWPSVLDKLAEKAPALAATFDGARPVAFDDEGLAIGFAPDQPFNKRKAESPDRRQALIEAFEAVTGEGVSPRYVMLDEEAAAAPPPPDTPAPGSEQIDEDELLERLKSEFDAEEVS
jgi:DNA polymerase-3 subunit gamma/tau